MKLKIGIALVLFVVLAGCSSGKGKGAVAKVGDQEISQKELDKRVKAFSGNQPQLYKGEEGESRKKTMENKILESLISEKLLEQEALRRGAKIDSKAIEKQAEAIVKNIPEHIQKQQGLNADEMAARMKRQAVLSFLQQDLSKGVTVSEKEIKEYYAKNKTAQFPSESLNQAHSKVESLLLNQKVFAKIQDLLKDLKKKVKIEQ